MLISIVDVESTGLGDEDEVCEIAVVYVATAKERTPSSWSQLIKPTRAIINIEARAAHHITDEMLLDQPTMMEFMKDHKPFAKTNVLAAHNASFDRRLLLQSGLTDASLPVHTICTLACARHLLPDAPAYSNQVLRYYLGIDTKNLLSDNAPMHRALPDAIVTAEIFRKLYEMSTIGDMIELTTKPALLKKVSFGQHRGKLWSDVADLGYLRWIISKDFGEDVKHTAQHWLKEKGQTR